VLLGVTVSYRGRALPLDLSAHSPQLLKKSLWALRLGLPAVILQAFTPPERSRRSGQEGRVRAENTGPGFGVRRCGCTCDVAGLRGSQTALGHAKERVH